MESRAVESLEPLVSERTRVLVLGSMPGDFSLELGQYYAHRRNRFWQVMAALSGIDPLSKYSDRCDALQQAGGRVEDAANRLGLSRKGLYLKRQRLHIDSPSDEHAVVSQ